MLFGCINCKLGYIREFKKTLKISIPEGYEVQNPEDLKIFADYTKNGKQFLMVESNYTLHVENITISYLYQ